MGYYTGDGFYVYEEADIADPGAGFSELLNKATQALPAAIRARVIAELAADPTIIAAMEAGAENAIATKLALAKCVHLESGKWVWDGPNGSLATHYLLPDHTGSLVARPTPFPVPSATSPALTW
ncbi:hypothetical protein ASF87_16740 [Microbacterium sp. Leaf161]|uniref:hypothetical protein n=1 Tax=Microbacterium sp. Leaf161 TaxID=1736281 RepID=UPI0006F599C7|nr:hypothetical protein [Microbacterium sp. Leaf161]KQR43437.1 hypothetical protein ASF87_16740 [Microbacterium sp. Leaf161]